MPIALWSDYVNVKKPNIFLFENAKNVLDSMEETPFESKIYKAVLSQCFEFKTKKSFLKIVLPQFSVETVEKLEKDAFVCLACSTFRLKRNNFAAEEIQGDDNLVIAIKREGVYVMVYSDTSHFVEIHHRQSCDNLLFSKFVSLKSFTTEYLCDVAVAVSQGLAKLRSYSIV